MRDGSQIEAFDPRELVGIDGVERKIVGDCGSCDHGVIAARSDLAAALPERGCHSAEGPGCVGVEGQRLEIGPGLLSIPGELPAPLSAASRTARRRPRGGRVADEECSG